MRTLWVAVCGAAGGGTDPARHMRPLYLCTTDLENCRAAHERKGDDLAAEAGRKGGRGEAGWTWQGKNCTKCQTNL